MLIGITQYFWQDTGLANGYQNVMTASFNLPLFGNQAWVKSAAAESQIAMGMLLLLIQPLPVSGKVFNGACGDTSSNPAIRYWIAVSYSRVVPIPC